MPDEIIASDIVERTFMSIIVDLMIKQLTLSFISQFSFLFSLLNYVAIILSNCNKLYSMD